MSTSSVIRGLFRQYYSRGEIKPPRSMERREFGFLAFGEAMMLRHMSFRTVDELKDFLVKSVPAHVYCSAAYYRSPTNEMDRKGWMGGDLIFDIDADHLPTPCKGEHDHWVCGKCGRRGEGPEICSCGAKIEEVVWFCDKCLEAAKSEVIKLITILTDDFGSAPNEIKVYFSVTGDTPVLIRDKNGVRLVRIKEAVDLIRKGGSLETLSLNKEGEVVFSEICGYLEHDDEIYEIYHEKSDLPVRLTGHHSVFILNDEGKITSKRTSEIRAGDYAITFNDFTRDEPASRLDVIHFSYAASGKNVESAVNIDEGLMRLVGYYLAGGRAIKGSPDSLSFSFNGEDAESLRDCMNLVEKIMGKRPYICYTRPSDLRLMIRSKKWRGFLKRFCGDGVYDRHLPPFSWECPRRYVLELLRGCMRGGAYSSGNAMRVKSRSRRLITELTWLCKLNGITCSLHEGEDGDRTDARKGVRSNGERIYILSISRAEFSGGCGRRRGRDNSIDVVKITKVAKGKGREKVYDISVKDNEAFFGNYYPILLHNSGHRGYHIHVVGEDFRQLNQMQRKELTDYITATGLRVTRHIFEMPDARFGRAIVGPSIGAPGWGGRLAKAIYGFILSATRERMEEIGLKPATIQAILDEREMLSEGGWEDVPWSFMKGVGLGSWIKIARYVLGKERVMVDTVVTTDIHRLIRMPTTLHGKTGLLVKEVPIFRLDAFDPLSEAVAFDKGYLTINVKSSPRFRVGDQEYGPYEGCKVTIPVAPALLLLCKGLAEVA